MTLKLEQGIHLTSTEKRHLKQMLEQGLFVAKSKKISYRLESLGLNRFSATIRKNYTNDYGEKRIDTSRVIISIN